jgi:uncharacterized protein YjiS (DUF1127 family)
MKIHTAQSLHRIHGIASITTHRKSSLHRLRTALLALSHGAAELCRTRRDRACLLGMTEYQLRDVGLHRVESGIVVHTVPPADAGA